MGIDIHGLLAHIGASSHPGRAKVLQGAAAAGMARVRPQVKRKRDGVLRDIRRLQADPWFISFSKVGFARQKNEKITKKTK